MSNEIEQSEDFTDDPEVLELQKKLTGMSKDVMKKTTDGLRTEISQISSKISQLKKKREEHNSQARHYRSMRDNVSDEKFTQIEHLREEADKEKNQRDECNEKIRTNKQRREDLKENIRAAWDKVKELKAKYYKMKDEVGVLPEDITNEIRDLEWKQQTTTMSPDDDAELTKRITELYVKAYTAHMIGFSSEELEQAIETAKQLSEEHDTAHQNVVHFAEEGQKHHQRMLNLYKELDEVRSSGGGLHGKYLEARQAADIAHQRIVELYEKIKLNQHMMDMIDEEQIRRRQEKSLKLKQEKIVETKKKQASSKRMTLDELKLLMGEDEEEEEME